ncbi:MAG: glycosyltransferase family 39 protein [Syntrophobacteraceae bacterium]|nr:glycosyltransferase family 39 protein [Syntrophobacteraceae bacterium]
MGSSRLLRSFILIALWLLVFIATISRPALFDDADSFHAEAVREMVLTGDWTTLRLDNGIRYLEKAPLMYWLAATSASAFGFHDWAVRLPVALFSLFLILLVYRFGARFFGEKAGFYSGIVIATCLGHYAFTRIFLPDVLLTFFLTFCLYAYARLAIEEVEPKKLGPVDLWSMAIYVGAALGMLSKGLIAIVFPGAIIFCHILLTGNRKVIARLQIGYGTIVFLLVSAPWHVAATLANSDFLWFYFIREHVLRYLGLRYPKDYGTVPPLLFSALLVVWLLPWSAFLWQLVRDFPKALVRGRITEIRSFHLWRQGAGSEKALPGESESRKREEFLLLLFVWIAIVLLFFSFGTTQEYYTFPVLSAFALLLGHGMEELDSGKSPGRRGLIGLGVMSALTIIPGAAMIALTARGLGRPLTLSHTLTANPKCYNLSFGHLHDLTAATFHDLAPLVYRTALLLIAGPLAAFLLACKKRWKLSYAVLAVMMIGLCHCYNAGMIAFEPVLSSRALAQVISAHYRPGDTIVIDGNYELGSSLNYYTGRQVDVLNGDFGVLWYGLRDKTAPKLRLTQAELLDRWRSGRRIFLFGEQKALEKFVSRQPDLSYRILAKNGGKEILVNWK